MSKQVGEMIHEDLGVDEKMTAYGNSLIQVQVPCEF